MEISRHAFTVRNTYRAEVAEPTGYVKKNETGWDIVSTKLSQGSKSGLFESYKKKCLDVMDTILESQENVAEKSRISAMRTQLESKNYSEDSFTEDIFNLSKLCHTLSE